MGLDISGTLCGGTRDATEGATVKGSIDDENTILCETDNAKLLERTRCLPAKENKRQEISFAHFAFAQLRLPVDVGGFPATPFSRSLGIRGRDQNAGSTLKRRILVSVNETHVER